ncbi:MAG: proline--tRNA ligase [Candidatus Korarchaeum sp.]|jgi:prolyl-tRNA synthetase|nr:proline--tRNA ligase [Candidatus Korarchaeum sp.]
MSEREAYEVVPKEEDFSRWFDEVIFKSEILDERYPVKGVYVWLPYGYEIMENIMNIMERLLRQTGHKRVYFPSIIPESVLSREFRFIKGFQDSVFWITKLGRQDAPEKLALRPTSEAIMYEVLSKWISSYRDLPIRIYQIVPIYRYETKATRPMLRVREVAFFKEGHTFHATYEEAVEQVNLEVWIYKSFYDELLIPYIVVKTLPWDTFPGALYNYDIVTIMPDGKALELGSAINFGDLFARTYDLTYMDEDGKRKNVNTTSFGISERSLAAVIAIHGDNRGLRLPPKIAPIQIVIVPIPTRDYEERILEYSREVKSALERNFRVHLDDGEERPGYKFYKWEMKGVPIRIEIGRNELERREVTIFRRDKMERETVPFDELNERIPEILRDIERVLSEQAWSYFKERIFYARSMEELVENVKTKVVSFAWCGKEECAHEVEEKGGYGLLGYEEDALKGRGEKCIVCGDEARHRCWIGRSY